MQRSEHRILTTHAGSLPRPAELTTLFARRVRGEAVDAAAIEAQGRSALRAIVARQIETGLDVIDDVTRHYSVDEDRIVLGGLSNGGVGAYAIGTRHAWRFSAVTLAAVGSRGPALLLFYKGDW